MIVFQLLMKTQNVSIRNLIKLNEVKNRKSEYTVFRAYNKYWIVETALVSKCSAVLSDIKIVCGVDKISINEVVRTAQRITGIKEIEYQPIMTVRME